MKLQHFIGRGIFALFGAILLGAILAGGLGLFIGFVAFITTVFIPPMSLQAALIGAICGAGLGFLYGAYHGLKIGNYVYQKFVEKNPIIAEPSFLSGRSDAMTHSNELIHNIEHFPKPDDIRLLTQDEIREYRQIILANDDRVARSHLNHYEDFINDARNLSLSKARGLHLQFPITIEHKKESRFLAKTYEKSFLADLIDKEKDNAKEPFKGYFLTSPNIRMYAGFPNWIKDFVAKVLNVLARKNSTIEVEKEDKQENLYTTLFLSPKNELQPVLPKGDVESAKPNFGSI